MLELSHPQKRIIINQQIYTQSKFAYMYGFVEILDQTQEEIQSAICQAIAHFDCLRIRFYLANQEIVQSFVAYEEEEIPIKDFSFAFSEVRFNLINDKLYRFYIIKENNQVQGYYFIFHHAIVDAYSITLITKYIEELLLQKSNFLSKYSFHTFLELEHEYLESGRYNEDEAYFKEKLASSFSFQYIPSFDLRTERIEMGYSEEETRKILSFCKDNSISVYKLFLTSTLLCLYKLNKRSIQTLATTHHHRTTDQLLQTAGMMVGTVLIVQKIDLSLSFNEFIRVVNQQIVESLNRHSYPIERLISEFNKVNPFVSGAMEYSFNSIPFGDNHYPVTRLSPNEDISKLNFKLNPHSKPKGSNIEIAVDYQLSEFTKEKAWEILRTIREILFLFIDHQNERMGDYLEEPKDIIRAIDQCCIKHPDQLAIVSKDLNLTYGELHRFANSLASELKSYHQVIGIINERSGWYVVGILAILKAGKSFVTIDKELPLSRQANLMRQVKMDCLLVFDDGTTFDIHTINIKTFPYQEIANATLINDLGYLIFTSGSTGSPKGVLVKRSPLLQVVQAVQKAFSYEDQTRLLGYANFNFDVSILEIFLALSTTSTLYITDNSTRLSIKQVEQYISHHQINYALLPTKFGELFISLYSHASLKALMLVGEKMNYFNETSYQLYNGYGPTEFTILSHIASIHSKMSIYSIGKPLSGVTCLILDEEGNPCSSGELYLGGEQIAYGYLDDYVKTSDRFIKPLNANALFYRTGDYVSVDSDNNYFFHSRIDRQIKYHGYRIELAEIENVAKASNLVQEGVSLFLNDKIDLVVIPLDSFDESSLQAYLKEHLPSYSLPHQIITCSSIPTLTNGKVDYRALERLVEGYQSKTIKIKERLTKTEAKLLKILKRFSNMPSIQATDNLLNLDLDSLDMIKISLLVERKFKRAIDLHDFYTYPTLREFALFLNQTKSGEDIRQIQVGEGIPLVIVFDLTCGINAYQSLIKTLPFDIPIITIISHQIPKSKSLPQYIEGILQNLQKEFAYSQYDIVGYSAGGVVALEMAMQLKEKAHHVYLIDTPNYYRYPIKSLFIFKYFFSVLSLFGIGVSFFVVVDGFFSLFKRRNPFKEMRKFRKMLNEHQVKEVNGKVTLFKSSRMIQLTDEHLGWDFKNMEVYYFNANHINIMSKKNITTICNIIKERR